MRRDRLLVALVAVLIVALFSVGVVWRMAIYRECRSHDFSVMYCLGTNGR